MIYAYKTKDIASCKTLSVCVHVHVLIFQPIENNEVPEYVSEIPAFMALLQPPGGKSYLTLKAPITTAADNKFCNIFPNFQKK